MIVLSGSQSLSSGDFRHFFLHPEDPTKCIKLPKRSQRTSHRGRIESLFCRPPADSNRREFDHYHRLTAMHVPLARYFPKMHGPVETDLGTGLCFDLVRGSQGDAPVSLSAIMKGEGPDGLEADFILSEVTEFARFCQRYAILASCNEPGNIAFVHDGEGFRLVTYDLKVRLNKGFIPVSTLFASIRRRKVQRRFDRLFEPLVKNLNGLKEI
ncbi:YrbL family protein [Breoghania sp.]|uniref:YrbL family protein n=1 Tax=Breoghania sp. TaxID=2065378 RepID=UPI00261F3B1E|nr:YrbL family protein [Breoghania sp.]MDJ0930318.1 YrbL family protein [Breoghania sp.]